MATRLLCAGCPLIVKVMYEAGRQGARRMCEDHMGTSRFNASAQCLCCFGFEDFKFKF
ncbi:hypothetical protein IC582_007811 [Cucumis melo]